MKYLLPLGTGPKYQFEASIDGINYEYLGIKWNPGLNNFFSITIDLDSRLWHTYFHNAYGDKILSDNMSINSKVRSEISHMRIINSGCSASYSIEIGVGKAVRTNEFEINYLRRRHKWTVIVVMIDWHQLALVCLT